MRTTPANYELGTSEFDKTNLEENIKQLLMFRL
jgi:hypothetical protein